ncbi:hypothetical protein D3P09_06925 [Paenibacillus pinisoli]|uniref:receptor protein-tyrosine kinase n=1 Tax=Paenibacillus pinisoli TaxID=1276110 RepID=A0A3A6PJW6_9BACL|nr:hypothetical protein D3P09_06925 [Paenibacillus pinisoli]
MKKRSRKLISILIVITIFFPLFEILHPIREINAAYIGNNGFIPAGGTSGKGGGICPNTTIYRIGIFTEDLKKENQFVTGETSNGITQKIINQFQSHMPDSKNAIMFVPSSCYTTNAALGYYEASNGNFIVKRRDITGVSAAEILERREFHDAKVRKLVPLVNNPYPEGLFYLELVKKAPKTKPLDFSTLSDGKWKSIAASIDPAGTKSERVWQYLLGNKELIQERIKNYYGESLIDRKDKYEVIHQSKLMYLDFLMTLYSLAPKGEEKEFYVKEINKFLEQDPEKLNNSPILFSLDTAVRFSSPAQLGSTYLYMPSISFVEWMHGATDQSRLTDSKIAGPKHDTKALIVHSAKLAMNHMPSRKRNTDKPSNTDGFTWGYSGVVGDTLRTNSTNKTAVWYSSSVVGVMESLIFHGNMFGFNVMGGPHNLVEEPPNCKCGQNIALPNKAKVEGKLESEKVGKKVELSIDIKQSDPKELEKWKKLLDTSSNVQMRVKLWRSQAPGDPIWEKATGPEPFKDNEWVKVDKKEVLGYLGGKKLLYRDNLMDYEVPEDVTQEFKYNANVYIKGIAKNGEEFSIQCKMGESLSTFITGPTKKVIEKETGSYTSYPEYWSEIKQGSPENEVFEAMAGTPTTENLYFATGGSEFIVDLEVEYVPEMTSTRTYRSYFTGGVPSEFKEGDQAKNYTVPAPSGASSSSLTVNAHEGGEVSATWTGTTKFTGSVTWGDHWTNVNNKWDDSAYNAAKAQAQAWVAAVNGFTIRHTAASDKETRQFKDWKASITTDTNPHPAGYADPGQKAVPEVPCSGDPCTGGVPAVPYKAASGKNGEDGQYTITVTARVPARVIDGPSSIYDLPGVEDTWTQTITYDYTKITKAKVWKIDRSKVNGMATLTGTDEITASIVQGDPVLFYNIANEDKLSTKASEEGRLRYSLETNQHDVVVWNEGPRTNKDDGRGDNGWVKGPGQTASWANGIIYTNKGYGTEVNYHASQATLKDKKTKEYEQFDKRRKTLTKVTAVSDFLILQTSSGDQSVMYFDKVSAEPNGVEAQKPIDIPKTPFADQWNDNKLSAAKWEKNAINIGSYNGKFMNPSSKYSKTGASKVETVFDNGKMPAGLIRPAKPQAPLRLVNNTIDVIDTLSNGLYVTGDSSVFYRNILNEGTASTIFPTSLNSRYGANGVEFGTTYSNDHSKVNDIVLHNPVSVEFARVVSLPGTRDQRTASSKLIGGNLQPPTIDYERRLKKDYRQNLIVNGDAEVTDSAGLVAGWLTWTETPGSDVLFTNRSQGEWVIADQRSFEIQTRSKADGGKDYSGKYYKDIAVKPNTQYKFSGDISCHRCEGYFYLGMYNGDALVKDLGMVQSAAVNTGTVANKEMTFTTSASANKIRINIMKGKSSGGISGSKDHLFADNIRLENLSVQEWIPTDPVYELKTVNNPNYKPEKEPVTKEYAYKGTSESLTVERDGLFTFEVWGAQGFEGGNGGYAKGSRELKAGDVLHFYTGGQNGFNGGGAGGDGATDGTSGGGASDVRLNGTNLNNRIIVAGGGGGRGGTSNGGTPSNSTSQPGSAGGAAGLPGSSYSSSVGGAGGGTGTSTDGGTGGAGGTNGSSSNNDGTYYQAGGGGAGGGYYGGGGGGSGAITGSCSNRGGSTGEDGKLGIGGAGADAFNKSSTCGYYSYPGGGGGGGSSWTGTLANAVIANGDQAIPNPRGGTQTGHAGNGFIRITAPGAPASGSPTMVLEEMIIPSEYDYPDEAYENVAIESKQDEPVKTPDGTYEKGNFINLDYQFQIFFPNLGNFYGNGAHGLYAPSVIPGKGFTDPMNTTKWTASKQVKFAFFVTYNGKTYSPDTWIDLDVAKDTFDFYLPLANSEAISALVQFRAIANNAEYPDGEHAKNKSRFLNLAARHSAISGYNIDLVGRIGALVIEDTGDYRFSNLFKKPLSPVQWYIPNVVKRVNPKEQLHIVADPIDVRGEPAAARVNYLDTYGLLPHLRQNPISLPLSPEKNNIKALNKQPMRLGYELLADIQTLGNYYERVQIVPYYYSLSLSNGAITPVDIYMNVNNQLKLINKHGAAVPGWDPSIVHSYVYALDWNTESGRRNYTEEQHTKDVDADNTFVDDLDNVTSLGKPYGSNYPYGIAQVLNLSERNRTFIGTSRTNDVNRNPGGVIPSLAFGKQGQRWHFSYGPPSSTVAVKQGELPSQVNIDKIRNNTTVLLVALDIKSVGDTYTLQYRKDNGSVNINGTSWPLSIIPYPVVAVYSTNRTSADDLTISGTH